MGSCRHAARIALAIASAAYSGGRFHGGGVRFDGAGVRFHGGDSFSGARPSGPRIAPPIAGVDFMEAVCGDSVNMPIYNKISPSEAGKPMTLCEAQRASLQKKTSPPLISHEPTKPLWSF